MKIYNKAEYSDSEDEGEFGRRDEQEYKYKGPVNSVIASAVKHVEPMKNVQEHVDKDGDVEMNTRQEKHALNDQQDTVHT